jgi:hypothetical protein
MPIGASEFALSIFFNFSQAVRSLKEARGFWSTSILYSDLNLDAKCLKDSAATTLYR